MTEDEAAVLATIVAAPEAWCERDPIELRWPGVLTALEWAGLVDPWERPDYRAVTLTPIAAFRLRVEVREHWVMSTEDTGAGQCPPSRHLERVGVEVPGWHDASTPEGPVRLPRRAHEVPLRFPDRVVDHRAPELLLDGVTGEPVKLFGRTVVIDPRLGPKRAG